MIVHRILMGLKSFMGKPNAKKPRVVYIMAGDGACHEFDKTWNRAFIRRFKGMKLHKVSWRIVTVREGIMNEGRLRHI